MAAPAQQMMDQQVPPEQQGLPPGPPPMGEAEAVPADLAGQGPPIEQMPMGGPQIPPELMAQMGGI